MKLTHPYPVIRLKELKTWADSGFYQSILDGNYLKRGYGKPDAGEDLRKGYEYYRETVRKSDDPIVKTINTIGEGIEKAAGNLEDRIRGIFKP